MPNMTSSTRIKWRFRMYFTVRSVAIAIFCLWSVGGAGPTLLAANDLYVTDNSAGAIVEFDGATGALLGTFASGGGVSQPSFLTCAPNGNLLVTRHAGNHVAEFDNATGTLVGVFAATNLITPTGLTIGPNGNLFVVNRDLGTIVEFDGGTGEFVRTFASGVSGQPHSLAFGPTGNLFVAMGTGARELDGMTGEFVYDHLAPSGSARGLTFGPDGGLFVSLLITNTVVEFNVSERTLVRTLSGLSGPHGIRFGPNGSLFVANATTNQIVEFDEVSGTFVPFTAAVLSVPIGLMFGTASGPCSPIADAGPLVSGLTVNPNPASVEEVVLLSAEIDETNTGGATIDSAEFEIRNADGAIALGGTGNNEDCPTPYSLCPQENNSPEPKPAFDEVSEAVQATIPAGALPAGVYEVCVRGTDANENVGDFDQEGACAFLVIYDPSAGFVTGGGWFTSPAGAYKDDLSLSGKANFGFVSKYKKGANIPTGQTQFRFKAGDLNFHSGEYEWLVVAGPLAQYKGSGTVNGEGNYGFLLTAKDSAINGGPAADTFRIKIWDKDAGDSPVYDNGTNQEIDQGNIVIHTN